MRHNIIIIIRSRKHAYKSNLIILYNMYIKILLIECVILAVSMWYDFFFIRFIVLAVRRGRGSYRLFRPCRIIFFLRYPMTVYGRIEIHQ